MSEPERPVDAAGEDFSIMLGGPMYQAFRKLHLTESGLDHLKRRLVGIPLFTWIPVVALAIWERGSVGNLKAPLLHDIEAHVRCLVAIPLLILAEVVVHRRLGGMVGQFVTRRLIAPDDMRSYDAMKASAMRLRDSVIAEVIQVVLAYGLHHWGKNILLLDGSWLGSYDGGEWHYTSAGAWYAFVTLPIFRVLVFRWYWRLFIWYRFLWQVKGLDLQLDALHPDQAGGLGFLANMPAILTPLLLAHSAMVAAWIQNKIWSTGKGLLDFMFELGGVVALLAIISFTPLFFFAGKLALAKRKAGADFGALASRYVGEFREKWLGPRASTEPIVGSGDIQSLADLSGAYDAIRETRFVPITRQSFLQLIGIAGLPLIPLVLNLPEWDKLLQRALGFLF